MLRIHGGTANLPEPLRTTVLVNPAARRVGPNFDGQRIVRYLEKQGVSATLVVSGSPAEATASAREAAGRGEHLVFAVGGDGTLRDVALGLAHTGTALAAIPAGTVNVWAREAGIPLKGLRAAIDSHLNGQTVHMDLGRAGDHCFLLMAGIGWDAEITSKVSLRLKKKVGDLAYVYQTVRMAPWLRPRTVRWTIDGEVLEEDFAWTVLSNSRLYGGRVQLTPGAAVDDGVLDGLVLAPRRAAHVVRLAGKVVLHRHDDDRLREFKAVNIRVETAGIQVQLDGDYFGETPMSFSVDQAALLVSLPSGPLPPIFGRAHVDHRKL